MGINVKEGQASLYEGGLGQGETEEGLKQWVHVLEVQKLAWSSALGSKEGGELMDNDTSTRTVPPRDEACDK